MLIKLIGTSGTFNFVDNRDLSIHLEGKASQNNQTGTFEIDLLLPGLASSSWQQLKQDIIKYFSLEGGQKANFYAKINNFPADLLDRLEILKTNAPLFHSLLGDHFNLTLEKKPSHEGINFDLTLSSPRMQGNFPGKISKEVLTLNKPLKWNFLLTPELRDIFIKKKIPILRSVIQGEGPISLTIHPNGFSCSLNPFDASTIQIEKGSLELGKIQFQNEGDISSILNLISPIEEKQFTLWFTPLYFQMNKGVIQLGRFDFLVANLYQLASWGRIDLKNHQSSLILGITSQSLNYAFGIKGLKEDYILQIPLREKNGRIEIDKKQAVARISALLAQVHGNDKTKLLGNVLELVTQPAAVSPPLPTTTPFPWSNAFQKGKTEPLDAEKGETEEEIPPKEGKKKRKKNQQLILDELEKEASGLLKKWIK
jgi:hypothetical protein